jgi:hypothetical protein
MQDASRLTRIFLNPGKNPRESSTPATSGYATFRLTEGVDVYFLAKQMGTSVKMIEDHYGHITPAKNAERILQGIPGWEPCTIPPRRIVQPRNEEPRGERRFLRSSFAFQS